MRDIANYRQLPWEDLVALTHNAASRIRGASSDDDAISSARSALRGLEEMSRRSGQATNPMAEFSIRAAVLSRAENLGEDLSFDVLLGRLEDFLLPTGHEFGAISESNREELRKGRALKNLLNVCRPIESALSEANERLAYWYEHFENLP